MLRGAIVGGIVGLVVLLMLLSLPVPQQQTPARRLPPLPAEPVAGSPFERALYEAREWRRRGAMTARSAMEMRPSLEEADDEAWRRALLASDPQGAPRRALAAARRAAELARTPEEKSRAVTLRVAVECEAGHHREELRQARRLAAIEGGSLHALTVLLRAARCNREEEQARETAAALAALPEAAP